VLQVHTAPVVELAREGGWEIVLWLGHAFDYHEPFRAHLEEIACLLGEDPARALALPPYEEYEDFVEGSLKFASHELSIYYEHSLGYLSISHPCRLPLDAVIASISPAVTCR
jgi:hypothetical protein